MCAKTPCTIHSFDLIEKVQGRSDDHRIGEDQDRQRVGRNVRADHRAREDRRQRILLGGGLQRHGTDVRLLADGGQRSAILPAAAGQDQRGQRGREHHLRGQSSRQSHARRQMVTNCNKK